MKKVTSEEQPQEGAPGYLVARRVRGVPAGRGKGKGEALRSECAPGAGHSEI